MFTLFKAAIFTIIMVISLNRVVNAQNSAFQKQLEQSQYLNKVMKIDSADAGMTRWLKKEVQKSRILPLAEDFDA